MGESYSNGFPGLLLTSALLLLAQLDELLLLDELLDELRLLRELDAPPLRCRTSGILTRRRRLPALPVGATTREAAEDPSLPRACRLPACSLQAAG
jgi:hypothetical protein